jgi:hypothetical protein
MHPLWTFLVMRAATCSDSALQLQACKGLTDEVPSGDVVAGLARKTEQGRTVCGIPSCKLTAESSGDAKGGARYVYPIQQSKDAKAARKCVCVRNEAKGKSPYVHKDDLAVLQLRGEMHGFFVAVTGA